MTQFDEVTPKAGVDAANKFMVVSLNGAIVVALDDAKGFQLQDAKKLDVSEITTKTYPKTLHAMHDQFAKWNLDGADQATNYLASVHGQLTSASRLLLVKGNAHGETAIQYASGKNSVKIRVAVVPPKQFNVAFKFVEVTNNAGDSKKTKWDKAKAQDFLNVLNWTFGPQANVSFKLADASPLSVNVKDFPLKDSALTGQVFQNLVAGQKYKSADFTVFLVKDYISRDKKGMSEAFPDEMVCAVADDPPNVVLKGEDKFEVTFAHEVCHLLQDIQQPSEAATVTGHHSREGILMSTGKESSRVDEALMRRINVP